MSTQTEKKRLVSCWIDKEILARLLVIAKREDRSQSFMINTALRWAVNALERGVEP